ncbi:MAG: response regulator transcription factor [Actinomycetota bacterium]
MSRGARNSIEGSKAAPKEKGRSPLTVLIADALVLFSDALAAGLSQYPQFDVLEERPSDGPATVDAVIRLRPDVALVDYWLPQIDGSSITRSIHFHVPECKVLIVSALSSASRVEESVGAGAIGFLPKSMTVAQVAEVIDRVLAGESLEQPLRLKKKLDEKGDSLAAQAQLFERLSPRELEVLIQLNSGYSAKQMAKHLSLGQGTIRNYISSLLVKTETGSAVEVVAKARSCGYLRS